MIDSILLLLLLNGKAGCPASVIAGGTRSTASHALQTLDTDKYSAWGDVHGARWMD